MHTNRPTESWIDRLKHGQALIEYALILVLVAIAFAVALAATGPAVGNVFSNAVYNLLGQTTTPRALGGANDFWLTVTWVASQTPQEIPLPTRTQPPPSNTPTAGPSPTPSATVPTNTPTPSLTPGPTDTPADINKAAPWYDPVDTTTFADWRVDKSYFIGSDDWFGSYFSNTTLASPADTQNFNGIIDASKKYIINYDWGTTGSPLGNWPAATPGENFSVKWTRPINLPTPTTLRFGTYSAGGLRVWITGGSFGGAAGSCGASAQPSGGPLGASGSPIITYANNSTDCLLIGKWRSGTTDTVIVDRTVPAGSYTLQVEYATTTGTSLVNVDITNGALSPNVSDSAINGGGSPTAGNIDCNWGLNSDPRNANSLQFTWEEYARADFAQNMRCHLEFRGSIQIPTTMDKPEMTFLDVWDYRTSVPNQAGWLEIAEYKPVGDPARAAPGYWIKVPLRSSNTTNYNWTPHAINLADAKGDGTGGSATCATEVDCFTGKLVTFRFVMQHGTGTTIRRWYIDDLRIDQAVYKNFRIGMIWNLDDPSQAADFLTTDRWKITSDVKHGADGGAWNDSPGGTMPFGDSTNPRYEKFNDNSQQAADRRIHFVEFRGFINLNDPAGLTDIEGDNGDPLLTFWHAYSLGARAWLEVQYTTVPYGVNPDGANWQIVPGTPGGSVVAYATSARSNTSMNEFQISLKPLVVAGITNFRLRFALMVQQDANQDDGWALDDIYLERVGKPRFTNFPFYDDTADSQGGPQNWSMGGSWSVTNTSGAFDSAQSYTDTPAGSYLPNTNSSFELAFVMDMNNDTPENLNPALNGSGRAGNTGGVVGSSAFLSFWHRRSLAANADALYVEWSKDGSTWNKLWGYEYRMTTKTASPSSNTVVQLGWERVDIDLQPVVASYLPADAIKTDDDIFFRFRLFSDAASVGDGVFLDNIAIENRTPKVYKWWTTDPLCGAVACGLGAGNGSALIEDVDNPFDWWNRWWNGGGWTSVAWEQHGGLNSFHESAKDPSTGVVQTNAPTDIADPTVKTLHQTFNVMEMQNILDMRGTDVTSAPTLYFWSRYEVAGGDSLLVQVSVENTAYTCAGGLTQCYEHLRTWGEWQTIWSIVPGSGCCTRTYTWQREQIALDNYAKNGATLGKRIRVRFVVDALAPGSPTNGDGWYLDDIGFKLRKPERAFALPFFDGARSLVNWVTEGKWGLDPEFFRGSGGGPASLGGTWAGYYWDCQVATVPTAQRCNSGSNPSKTDAFLRNRTGSPPTGGTPAIPIDRTEAALLDINKDIFNGPPVSGWAVVDRFVARYEQTTGVVGSGFLQPGTYTFITSSDDGVRMKYDTVPSTPGFINTGPGAAAGVCSGWNMICNWSDHGPTVDIGTADLTAGNTYKFTIEWFDGGTGAKLVMTIGTNSFSFTDTPKQGAGPSFPEVPAVKRGNSSLMLDGVLNLVGTNAPVLEFYTFYELDGNSSANVEVSVDGGFTWTQNNLSGGSFNTTWFNGLCTPKNTCSSTPAGEWRRRINNLATYKGSRIGLRFRLNRLASDCINEDSPGCSDTTPPYGTNGYAASWWVVDIRVLDP